MTDVDTEDQVTCCYAVQDKVWVSDPGGAPWEVYTVLADAPAAASAAACPTEARGTPADGCCAAGCCAQGPVPGR